jgi:hypothetical protein
MAWLHHALLCLLAYLAVALPLAVLVGSFIRAGR